MAAGSPTQALPSLPRALEEPKMHITQPDPAPRREPSPQGPVGRPTAELDHRPSANSKHNGESIPQMEQKGVCVCVCVCVCVSKDTEWVKLLKSVCVFVSLCSSLHEISMLALLQGTFIIAILLSRSNQPDSPEPLTAHREFSRLPLCQCVCVCVCVCVWSLFFYPSYQPVSAYA